MTRVTAALLVICVLALLATAGLAVWAAMGRRGRAAPARGNPYGDDRWTGSGGTHGSDWGPGP